MKLRLVVVLLAASTVSFSQTSKVTDHKPAEKKSEAAAPQGMPKPAAEAEKLADAFNGNWIVSGSTEAGPMGPAEKANGTETCRKGPGGFSVICDANMKFERMGPSRGHGVLYWDPENKNYTGLWCDNFGPCATQGIGTWDGDKLVLNSDVKMNGETSKMRLTYSDITSTSYKFLIEMSGPGGEMKPWMTLNYKRTAVASTGKNQ